MPTDRFLSDRCRWRATAVLLALTAGACSDPGPVAVVGDVTCDLDPDLLVSSLLPDAIPALTEPPMVPSHHPDADYLLDSDRVLGVFMNGEARAYPHNILWHHEIVNDRIGDAWISVTFCPLTGSGLAFAPDLDGRRLDLGVSGLLFANNLVLYDRRTSDVYGPQLSVVGTCGGFRGSELELLPVQETSWDRWKSLHPSTTVVSKRAAPGRDYTVYPYGSYDELTDNSLLVPMSVDRSRAIKERVLAVRVGAGGRGFPYGELGELGDVVAINETIGGVPTAIFYEASSGETALAFDTRVVGRVLTFHVGAEGLWVDRETGTTWGIDGRALDGPLSGERLRTRADAYTLFWFAWRHFQPEGRTFTAR